MINWFNQRSGSAEGENDRPANDNVARASWTSIVAPVLSDSAASQPFNDDVFQSDLFTVTADRADTVTAIVAPGADFSRDFDGYYARRGRGYARQFWRPGYPVTPRQSGGTQPVGDTHGQGIDTLHNTSGSQSLQVVTDPEGLHSGLVDADDLYEAMALELLRRRSSSRSDELLGNAAVDFLMLEDDWSE